MARFLVLAGLVAIGFPVVAQEPSQPVRGRFVCLEVERIKEAQEAADIEGLVTLFRSAHPFSVDGGTALFITSFERGVSTTFRVDGNHNGLVVMSGGYLAVPDAACAKDHRARGMEPKERRIPYRGDLFLPGARDESSELAEAEDIPACEYRSQTLSEGVTEDAEMIWRTLTFNAGTETLIEMRVGTIERVPSLIEYSCMPGWQ